MELAARTTHVTSSPTLAIDTKAKQMKAVGEDVCNLGAGEPDFDTPEHIRAAGIVAIEEGFTRYTPSSGLAELREAISEKLKKDNDLDYKPSQIIVTCGAKQACMNAILATVNADDEVIIPAPYWVSYPDMVRVAGGEPVIVETTEASGWKITAEQFADAMTPRTKMIILNSPNNPTGAVYSRDELEKLVEVADEEGIIILSDEIYEKLTYDDVKAVSVASISQTAYDLTITVNGFSKAYAMTGWRLGYVAAPENVAKAIDALQSHMTAHTAAPSQKAGIAALKGDQQAVGDMKDEFQVRRDYVHDRLSKMPNITVVKPAGAFYVLIGIERTALTSQNFCDKLLSRQKVALVPGIAFGNDRTVRLSYATSLDVIKKGLDRLEEFLRSA